MKKMCKYICSMKVLQSYSFLSSKLLLSGWNINYKFILIHIFINLVNYTVLILFIMFLINNRSQIISNWIFWGMLIQKEQVVKYRNSILMT